MKAYKGFDKNLRCRDFQYEIGKTYECDEAIMCKKGFHACVNPVDVYNYYALGSRFCEVNIEDYIEGDDKLCGKRITIVREFTPKEYVKECIKYAQTSGYKAYAKTSGYEAHAQTSGDYAHAQTSGKNSIACSLGPKSTAMAGEEGWIVLVEYDVNYNIIHIRSGKVGVDIERNVVYQLKNNQFVKVK